MTPTISLPQEPFQDPKLHDRKSFIKEEVRRTVPEGVLPTVYLAGVQRTDLA